METKTIRVDPRNPEPTTIAEAASLLQHGEVVAFPTETVYGLGARAFDTAAVAKIFKAKERPVDNPLIVHIADTDDLSTLIRDIPESAQELIETFWPGPLSLVLPKHPTLPSITTGGLDTVVVRFPAHPVAQELIRATGQPIAAPSANTSGKVSPTTAAHVAADLHGKIPLILDAGTIEYGLESTVVDCTTTPPVILRPGSITKEVLHAVLPDIGTADTTQPHRSPGMKYRHYSPAAPVILFTGEPDATAHAIETYVTKHHNETVAILWHSGGTRRPTFAKQLPAASERAAPRLFAALRALDELRPAAILVQGYSTTGLGAAIMNRLEKAASNIIVCN
ncbi:threonylcarbamoyl-AMP synthase [Candidatus Kaiserbacteria bacterium]|nr:threonylcarbamoyl-AMP synthase [Candidatus Kaiserbacteria bacterium]